jgi:hypothetical protein
VLAHKKRLGADSWGGSDAEVRHLLEPIEQLLTTEFPDYDPYPWGAVRHTATVVRNILLAEPLTQEWAARFEGVDAAEAAELAHDFRFERTTERTQLSALLRDRLGVTPS